VKKFVFIALLALATAQVGRNTAIAAEPFDVNVVLSLTGQGAFLGKQLQQSMQLIEGIANKSGGIGGRPLRFVFSDDQTNPQIDVQLFNDFIGKKAAVVIGPSFTAPCLAAAPLVLPSGPVMYCLSPAVHPTHGTNMFTVSASVVDDVSVFLRYFRLHGLTRIGVITSNDATGQDVVRAVNLAMARPENKTMKLVETDRFGLTDISVAAQMSRLKASNPDAIIAWTTGTRG